jgi:hypothetical protein
MTGVMALLYSLAVVAIAGAGIATIAGLDSVRARYFTYATILVVISLALPVTARLGQGVLHAIPTTLDMCPSSSGLAIGGFVLGHAALAVVLVARRRRGRENVRREAAELEQARGRGRPRLTPEGTEVER